MGEIISQKPSAWRIWWLAARPKTLWAGIAPVVMGGAVAFANEVFFAPAAFGALLFALLIQVGTNFCNDYADFKKGADTRDRIGPQRATQCGWVAPSTMLRATVLTFAAAALTGVYLIFLGGWTFFWIVMLSIAAGVAYTVGPFALAYLGLGELFVLIFFGPVAVGATYYLQANNWPTDLIVLGAIPGLLSCAILAVNNLRDMDQDREANKRTLAVRFGSRFARAEYVLCITLALLVLPGSLIVSYDYPWAICLGSLLGGILVLRPLMLVCGGTAGPALNPVLGETAKVLLAYAAGFTFGLIFAMIAP